jgi:hypothetical protein
MRTNAIQKIGSLARQDNYVFIYVRAKQSFSAIARNHRPAAWQTRLAAWQSSSLAA